LTLGSWLSVCYDLGLSKKDAMLSTIGEINSVLNFREHIRNEHERERGRKR